MFKLKNDKKGFTIIEVVLVLAIAGLIFLMVFIALPALQRSQRDSQRKTDVGRVLSKIQEYQGNNKNRLPGENEDSKGNAGGKVEGHVKSDTGTKDTKSWAYFYDRYLLSEDNDSFQDPNGSPYGLTIVTGEPTIPDTFKDQAANGNNIIIAVGRKCDGESTAAATGSRKVAVLYRGEGGAVICQNN